MTWRTGSLIAQALTNLWSERWRSAFVALLVLTICGLTTASSLLVLVSIRTEQTSRVDNGLNVVIASAESSIDASRCERLSSEDWVLASGSLSPGELDELTISNATKVPVGYGTAGFLDVVADDSRLAGREVTHYSVVGPALQEYLGIEATGVVGLRESGLTKYDSIGTSPKASAVAGWVVHQVKGAGVADQCWVAVDSTADANFELLIRAALVGDTAIQPGPNSDQLAITRLLGLNDRARNLGAEWADRPARKGLPGMVVLVTSLVALLAYLRRSEVGLYRALGMNPWHLLTVGAVEVGALVGGCLLATTIVAVSFVTMSDVLVMRDLGIALIDTSLIAATMQLLLPASLIVPRADVAEALRDR